MPAPSAEARAQFTAAAAKRGRARIQWQGRLRLVHGVAADSLGLHAGRLESEASGIGEGWGEPLPADGIAWDAIEGAQVRERGGRSVGGYVGFGAGLVLAGGLITASAAEGVPPPHTIAIVGLGFGVLFAALGDFAGRAAGHGRVRWRDL